jgi:hypothetical protein
VGGGGLWAASMVVTAIPQLINSNLRRMGCKRYHPGRWGM